MKSNLRIAIIWMITVYGYVFAVCGQVMAQDQAYATSIQPLKIVGSLSAGRIIPHNERFQPEVTETTIFCELGLAKVCAGSKAWHQPLGFPEIGAMVHYAAFGDSDIFGAAVSLFPFVQFKRRWSSGLDFNVRLGFGLAYLTHKYDPIDNPTNNVIGSDWNNITQLQLGMSYRINPLLSFSLASGLTHYSNGRIVSPNLGINALQVSLGVSYSLPGPLSLSQRDTVSSEPQRRNRWFFRSGSGARSTGLGISAQPVFTQTLTYVRATSAVNNLWFGTTYAWDRSKLQLLAFTEKYGPRPPRQYASDWSLFIGDELMVGKVGIFAVCGVYLYNPEYRIDPIYFKLGLQYYVLDLPQGHQIFTFTNIKSHRAIADYFEFGVGYKL